MIGLGGWRETVAAAFKQHQLKRSLEITDEPAYRRLRDVHCGCRQGDTSSRNHGSERFDLSWIEHRPPPIRRKLQYNISVFHMRIIRFDLIRAAWDHWCLDK